MVALEHICEHLSLFCAFPLKQPGLFFRLNWMLRSMSLPQGKFPGGGRTGKVPSGKGGGILSELALIFLPGRKPQDESSCHFAFGYTKEQSAVFMWTGGHLLHWAPSFLSHLYFFFQAWEASCPSFGQGLAILYVLLRKKMQPVLAASLGISQKNLTASPWVLLLLLSCKDHSLMFSHVHMFSPLLSWV